MMTSRKDVATWTLQQRDLLDSEMSDLTAEPPVVVFHMPRSLAVAHLVARGYEATAAPAGSPTGPHLHVALVKYCFQLDGSREVEIRCDSVTASVRKRASSFLLYEQASLCSSECIACALQDDLHLSAVNATSAAALKAVEAAMAALGVQPEDLQPRTAKRAPGKRINAKQQRSQAGNAPSSSAASSSAASSSVAAAQDSGASSARDAAVAADVGASRSTGPTGGPAPSSANEQQEACSGSGRVSPESSAQKAELRRIRQEELDGIREVFKDLRSTAHSEGCSGALLNKLVSTSDAISDALLRIEDQANNILLAALQEKKDLERTLKRDLAKLDSRRLLDLFCEELLTVHECSKGCTVKLVTNVTPPGHSKAQPHPAGFAAVLDHVAHGCTCQQTMALYEAWCMEGEDEQLASTSRVFYSKVSEMIHDMGKGRSCVYLDTRNPMLPLKALKSIATKRNIVVEELD